MSSHEENEQQNEQNMDKLNILWTTDNKHLQNIFASGELNENSVCWKFRHTDDDGKNYQVKFYNLETIISVDYKR